MLLEGDRDPVHHDTARPRLPFVASRNGREGRQLDAYARRAGIGAEVANPIDRKILEVGPASALEAKA